MKLKIEINSREHFTVMGTLKKEFSIQSRWYQGNCQITTYTIEELLGTKLRALYQRKKGRDLYDINKALTTSRVDAQNVVACYKQYITDDVDTPPTRTEFMQNLEAKINDPEFLGDIKGLILPTEKYDQQAAYEKVKTELIERI